MARRLRLLAFALALSLLVPLQADARSRPVVRPPAAAAVDAIAAAALERPLPGLAIAAGRDGRLLHDQAYGVADSQTREPLWSGSIFQIGSVTKQFTAAAILRLEERGKLSIEDAVSTWVPEFPAGGHHVTIRHLLNHTSGVPEYTSRITRADRPMTPGEIFDLIRGVPYAFPPGSNFEYSNTGYYALGVVIEKASGKRYADFVRQELLLPHGLLSTAHCGEPPADPSPSGHLELSRPGDFEPVDAIDNSLAWAAGGLCSTASDLVRWNEALHGGGVLSPQSYAAMVAPTRLSGGGLVGYGFGLGIGRDASGRSIVSHGGSILGFVSTLSWYPESRTSVAVLVNLTSLVDGGIAAMIAERVAYAVIPR
jgi:D-alanyl-D-alanine carboxypeptidase